MSASGKEIELKFALADAAELEKLAAALGGDVGQPVQQVNHFFDTAELDLHRVRLTLRLREENNGRYLLTAKGPGGSAEGALSERAELEAPVDARVAAAVLAGTESVLSVLERAIGDAELLQKMRGLISGKELKLIGAIENTRTPREVLVALDDGSTRRVVFELDRCVFPNGRVDFEVEVELQGTSSEVDRDALARAIHALVVSAGIPVRSAPSKAQRFFEILATR